MSRPGIGLSFPIGAVLAAIGIATFGMPVRGAHGQAAPDTAARAITDDALRAEMARCNALGLPAATDAACERAYAEHRRRFLAPVPARRQEPPVDMFLQRRRTAAPSRPIPFCRGGEMNSGVLDRFTDIFTRYIDSGFGLLAGEVAFLAATLIVIDIVLAGLFWAWGADDDVIARLVKKTLFVGFFAFLLNNWNSLAQIVFGSFAGLGLMAGGSTISPQQLLQPGRIAQVGIDAGWPILQAVGQLMGFVSFFANFVQIAVLMLAWLVVLIAFFVIAIQLFVTLIEFKLTTLAGFVLVPFGLFGKTAFLAERVLGNVVASGVKILVLAVIIGIGSTLFAEFTRGFGGRQPTLEDALALMLAALSLLGLAIFGPGIATGLISGAPQLGAGAVVGTGLAAGGVFVAGAAGARLAGGAAIGAGRAAAAASGGAAAAYRSGAAASGATGVARAAAGASTVVRAGAAAVGERVAAAFRGTAGARPGSAPDNTPPAWARRMRRQQSMHHGATMAAHAVRSGDHGGGSASVPLSQERP